MATPLTTTMLPFSKFGSTSSGIRFPKIVSTKTIRAPQLRQGFSPSRGGALLASSSPVTSDSSRWSVFAGGRLVRWPLHLALVEFRRLPSLDVRRAVEGLAVLGGLGHRREHRRLVPDLLDDRVAEDELEVGADGDRPADLRPRFETPLDVARVGGGE